MTQAILVGSSPIAVDVASWNLEDFYRVALNKAWAIRSDFNLHVGLKHKKQAARPPKELGLKTLPTRKTDQALERAGGRYFTSTGVALNAGYWALTNTSFETVVFAGCDMIYDPARYGGKTHFYGMSDAGPLAAQNHPAQMNPEARMTRMFCWGLIHRTVLFNATHQNGTLLIFPPVEDDLSDLQVRRKAFLETDICKNLISEAFKIFSYEAQHRTRDFDSRWAQFPKHESAVLHLEKCVGKWDELTKEFKKPIRESLP